MTIKVTMLMQFATAASNPNFPSHRIAGWSESWYYPGTNLQSAIAALTRPTQVGIITVQPLALARAAMLPLGGAIVGARFQVVNPPGVSQTQYLNLPGAGEGDQPGSALLISVPGIGVRNIRRIALRCLPDINLTEGEYSPGPTYPPALNAFFLALTQWQFQARDLTQPLLPLVGVSQSGLVTFAGNQAGIGVGVYIRILKSRDSSGFLRGGRFLVSGVGVPPNSWQITGWPYSLTTGGNARVDPGPIYPNVDVANISISRSVMRKVGRPFTGYRGRRSRRR